MKKKWLILSLLLACVLGATGCKSPANKKAETWDSGVQIETENAPTETKIFALPSTYKIRKEQDTTEYYNQGKTLSVSLAKNEYESAQLFIRPHKAVKSFDLQTSDLKTADGDTISAENIEVYAQWYIRTYKNSSMINTHPLGYYPDALVPLDAYREYDYDKIDAGFNQGITITVKTDMQTKAGVYTGEFTLTYDKATESIPVEVTVWNFAVPEENHVISALGNPFYEELIGGALDNTPEMYEKYNEYLLDYRINVNNLISPQWTVEQQIEKLRAYCNDERVTAYSYIQEGYNLGAIERKMRLLIENSDAEHNLLKKNFIYALDEPFGIEDQASAHAKAIVDLLISLADEYEKAGLLETYGLTKEDILSQDILGAFTQQAANTVVEGLRTYCPLVDGYKSQSDRDKYKKFREEAYTGANGELADNNYASTWWYTATTPNEPYPNQHMDAELYPLRACSWMQYEYGVKGYLNWGAFVYVDTTTLNTEVWDNPDIYYDPTDAIKATNGDGYIVYPGLKFGIDAPIPSLRMMTLTDGFEDYEYLYMFHNLAKEYASKYGQLALDKLIMPLYRSIYTDVEAFKKPEAVLEARETLAKYIELLSGEAHALVFVEDVDLRNNSTRVNIYAETGTTFESNGTVYEGVPYGEGCKIIIDCSLAESSYLIGTLKKGEQTSSLKIFLSEQLRGITTSDSEEEAAKFTVTQRPGKKDHITLSLDETLGEKTIKVHFGACLGANAYELANYTPSIILTKEDAFGDHSLDQVKTLNARIYNPSEKEIDISFQLETDSDSTVLATVTLASGWNEISIPNVNELDWEYKDQLTELRIAININDKEDVVLYLSKIYYTYTEA